MKPAPSPGAPDSGPGSSRPAERILLEFLEQLHSGEGVDFEELCKAHSELAEELRSLHSDHARRNPYFFGMKKPERPSGFSNL